MFTKRIIPCLDVNAGRVVKGVNFVDLKDAGDPVEIAKAYDKAGADELVFLDITASSDERRTVVDMVRQVAECVFIPFTVGGGIRTVDDFRAILREGADKISVNSSAINTPELVREYGIFVLPLIIRAKGREYRDGVDINAEDVYKILKTEIPKTSLPSGEDALALLRWLRMSGYTHAIAVMLSSGLSGTYHSACLAAEELRNPLRG